MTSSTTRSSIITWLTSVFIPTSSTVPAHHEKFINSSNSLWLIIANMVSLMISRLLLFMQTSKLIFIKVRLQILMCSCESWEDGLNVWFFFRLCILLCFFIFSNSLGSYLQMNHAWLCYMDVTYKWIIHEYTKWKLPANKSFLTMLYWSYL